MLKLKLIFCIVLLQGCAAAQLSMEKRELDVQTRTSTAIFLEPVGAAQPLLYLDIRSGVMEFDRAIFREFVLEELIRNGSAYRLTDDPNQADYHLSALIFNLEKADPTAAELALENGYGGQSLSDSVMSLADFSNDREDFFKMLAAAIVIGAVESAINATVKDVSYILVSDVEIRENLSNGAVVKVDTQVNQKVSDDGSTILISEEVSDKIKYRTRIVTTANQANLKLDAAKDIMFKQTAYAIAGIFAKDGVVEAPEADAQANVIPVDRLDAGSAELGGVELERDTAEVEPAEIAENNSNGTAK